MPPISKYHLTSSNWSSVNIIFLIKNYLKDFPILNLMEVLREEEAEDFLEKENFPISKRKAAKALNEALKIAKKIEYPVALKIQGKNIIHKSDVGGVILDIRNDEELENAFNKIKKIKGFEKVIVQEYKKGKLLLLGLKRDSVFGHIVAVGAGDIYTEFLKDVSLRICPIEEKEAGEMLKELKIYPILEGVRGEKPVNFNLIKKLIVKASQLPKQYPRIRELDINSLILTDHKVTVADARIIFD